MAPYAGLLKREFLPLVPARRALAVDALGSILEGLVPVEDSAFNERQLVEHLDDVQHLGQEYMLANRVLSAATRPGVLAHRLGELDDELVDLIKASLLDTWLPSWRGCVFRAS